MPRGKRIPWTTHLLVKMGMMWKRGMSAKAIAMWLDVEYGIQAGPDTVRSICRTKLGLEPHRPNTLPNHGNKQIERMHLASIEKVTREWGNGKALVRSAPKAAAILHGYEIVPWEGTWRELVPVATDDTDNEGSRS